MATCAKSSVLLQGARHHLGQLLVAGTVYHRDAPLTPGKWRAGEDHVSIEAHPDGLRFLVSNVESGTSQIFKIYNKGAGAELKGRVQAGCSVEWESTISGIYCLFCKSGDTPPHILRPIHRSVIDGIEGTAVTPHGWFPGHTIQRLVNDETGKAFFINCANGEFYPALKG